LNCFVSSEEAAVDNVVPNGGENDANADYGEVTDELKRQLHAVQLKAQRPPVDVCNGVAQHGGIRSKEFQQRVRELMLLL
jgi:hypothetical protein